MTITTEIVAATKWNEERAVVRVKFEGSERAVEINVYGPRHDFGHDIPAKVNWSALGSSPAEHAIEYAAGLALAGAIAPTLKPSLKEQEEQALEIGHKIEQAESWARNEGSNDGRSAASWYEVPDEQTAFKILKGIYDGDPEIMDTLPAPRLSGEFADDRTAETLVAEALEEVELEAGDAFEEADHIIVAAYEMAFNHASEESIINSALVQLGHQIKRDGDFRKCECGWVGDADGDHLQEVLDKL